MGKARRTKSGVKTSQLVILLLCLALITAGIMLLFFSLYAIYKVYDIPMKIEVGNVSGFNTDTDAVNFGKARPGNSNSRIIVMSHEYKKPLLVHFKKSGNISRFVDLPDDFYLEPQLNKEISINAVVPETASRGTYTGTLTVYFRRI